MREGDATPGVRQGGVATAPVGHGDGIVADGRVRRRVRTEAAVVDAVLDLLAEGHDHPTAQDVADRSGASVRTIFRLFDDMASLQRAAVARQAERVLALLVPLPRTGPRPDRVAALVRSRSRVFEAIAPVRRVALRLAPTSPPVAAELVRAAAAFRAEARAVFAAELRGARPVLLDALDAVTSWEAWERWRTLQGLGPDEAADALTLAVTALLATTD